MKTKRFMTFLIYCIPTVFPFQCALMSDVIVGILVAALHLVNGVLGELPS